MTLSNDIEVWVGALLSLMIFSFLYKDNPFYKFAEHLFVGVSAAYWMVTAFWATLVPNLIGDLVPRAMTHVAPDLADDPVNLWKLVPLAFSILLLLRLIPPAAHLSRMSMGLAIGFAAGTNLTRYLTSDFAFQIEKTMLPLGSTGGGLSAGQAFSNLFIVAGVVSGLVYFFFSKEHTGIVGKVSRFGIYVLMVSFGAAFGYTVMARISLLTGRMEFLLGNWLGIISP